MNAPFAAPEIADLAPLFPGYEIESLIATGGMGAVYRAVQKSLDRTVAIKILPHEFSKDAAFCAGFEAEAKAMARLNHPNLIGVYDFGEVNGMLFIIMEFVPGESVFHSAHGIAIDPREVIRLVTGICNGLSHAHENGIIHRDIKPSNILLDLNTQPKIGDFGLARPVENKIQEGEEIFGTPHYTAPEVVNSPHSVGFRADIFSVGVMLHELLTGKLPADDQRPASAIVHCDPRFDAIIRKATNTIPELRYASAAEMARDLQTIASSSGPKVSRNPSPKGPPGPSRVASGPARHPVAPSRPRKSSSPLPGMVMLIIAILVGISAYKYFTKIQQDRKPPPSEPENVIPSKTPESNLKDTIHSGIPIEPTPEKSHQPAGDSFSLNNGSTTPKDEPEKSSLTQPDPEPLDTTLATPKFDVDGFFGRARKIMQDRANPLIANRDASLLKNLEDFERAVKRSIRKLDFGGIRDMAETNLETYITRCKADGNRIPGKGDPKKDTNNNNNNNGVRNIRGFPETHEEYLAKQELIDELLFQSLSQLSSTYIKGLELQIERLKKDNDPAAVALIEEEVEKTRSSEKYFPYLMLGIDLEAEEKAKEDAKKKDGLKKLEE